jgi:hypothetical protein
MSDEDFYLDEPFRPVRARKRPLSDLEKRLIAEHEDIERRAIEARQTGKRSAEIKYTLINLPSNEEWAAVDVFDGRGYSSVAMPTEKAKKFVRLINDAHRHLDFILDAYLGNDPESALKYVRQLFSTLKKARQAGRPPEPYKEEVMTKTLAWLRAQDPVPRQARVCEFIENTAWGLGQEPSESTLKNWAKEALKLDSQSRQKGQ